MRIACIGDIHIIDPNGPDQDRIANRSFFIDGQKSLVQLFDALTEHRIELVIFLGDLVDWVCDANLSLAHEILNKLTIPWKCVPGNHDFAQPGNTPHRNCRSLWLDKGIDLSTQYIDCEEFGLVLLDNALGNIEDSELQNFDAVLNKKKYNIVCQHVPLALDDICSAIHETAPSRDLDNYTCSTPSDIYQRYYQNRVQAVVSGHVHIDSTTVVVDNCSHHLCNLGISIVDSNRNEKTTASANIIEFTDGVFSSEIIFVD